MDKFVHLHNHSDYSLLDGLCKIKDLLSVSVERNAPAVALTDHGNMFGALEFYTQAQKLGIKPIVGCELYMTPEDRTIKKTSKAGGLRYHIVLLAKNYIGYKNLTTLASEAYTTGFYYKPRIDKQLLLDHREGLICLSACINGEIPQLVLNGNMDVALETAKFYKEIFGDDFYLEIQRHGMPEQEKIIPGLAQLAEDLNIKLVATNDTHYLHQEHSEAHDILLCVGTQSKVDDENRMRFSGNEFFLKTSEQMSNIFQDFPDAISNTLEIAEKCDLEIKLDEAHYPVFHIPGNDNPTLKDADIYLRELALEGFGKRYGLNPSQESIDRFELEMKVILETGFSNYFLIVWDFVHWAKEQGVPVGPGRGSAAGCLVSYCLGITNLDPLKYDLLFERFLNPERISPPDIDIDFSDDRREEVIKYVRDKYGDDSVCRITTFGKMAAKSAVRDVARVVGLSIQEANSIAKLIPDGPNVKLGESIEQTSELKNQINSDPRFKKVIEHALTIEGSVRHSGTHAAGVVICPGRTVDYIPVYKMGGEGEEYTQYDMNWVDKLGLLKMDFLGLQTLTELDMTVKALQKRGVEIDLDNLDLADEKVFKVFSDGATIGVFQFESGGMRENLTKLKPTRIEDLIAMAALYRPGPMDNIPEYIACSHGVRKPSYLHEKLEPILRETHGVIIYQEQVMRTATDLAGFTLGKADILRKAMGKKKEKLMLELKPEFIDGCVANSIQKKTAEEIWDLLLRFANYGFVKAHAAGYALIAYQCGFLKAYHRPEYLASCLTVRRRNPGMMMKLLAECRAGNVPVLPPDINESASEFVATPLGIRFGLFAVKNVGDAAVNAIVAAQSKHGPFRSIHHFLTSVDLRVANKKVHESLIQSGAFDSLGVNRATLFESLPGAMAYSQAMQDERDQGQTTLFGGFGVDPMVHIPPPNFHTRDEWETEDIQSREKEMLGYYVTSHPLEKYKSEIDGLTKFALEDKEEFSDGLEVKICGVITTVSTRVTKRGEKWAILSVEDLSGSIECLVFPKVLTDVQDMLVADNLVAMAGRISHDNNEETKLRVEQIIPLDQAAEKWGQSLFIQLNYMQVNDNLLAKLETVFKSHSGRRPVFINVNYENGTSHTLKVGDFAVITTSELLHRIKEIVGDGNAYFGY